MRAAVAALTTLTTLAAFVACTSAPPAGTAPTSIPAPSLSTPSPSSLGTSSGPGSALDALRDLCTIPELTIGPPARAHGPVPPFVQVVERIAETHRGLGFLHPVPVDVETEAGLDAKVGRTVDASISPEQLARRSRAWRTIGVIPPGADLERSLRSFYRGQVLGFYVPETGELVVGGGGATDPSLEDGVVLAHELTHALDDQHFDLVGVDRLATRCRDERSMAALGAVEGSAQYFATSALADLRPVTDPAAGIGDGGGGVPADVPPFVQALQQWPYIAGPAFIQRRIAEGGVEAVNAVMRDLPVSTEQILHPERYPGDTPTPLDVPDLSSSLGPGWQDLDVMEVGEAWLRAALSLRIGSDVVTHAAPGWDGGMYRAWSEGDRTAVWLRTAWDSPGDAAEFADAMRAWIGEGTTAARVLTPSGSGVDVVFASDATTLDQLAAAATG